MREDHSRYQPINVYHEQRVYSCNKIFVYINQTSFTGQISIHSRIISYQYLKARRSKSNVY